MKINYMSDIHTEFESPLILTGEGGAQTSGGDILVLAGDIAVKAETSWVRDAAVKYDDVILINGNHEFYHGDISKIHHQIAKHLPDNVHYLECDSVTIGDQRFLGTTLWGGYHLPYSMQAANRGMNDHRIIRIQGGKFTAEEAKQVHMNSLHWLNQNIQEGDIVVTHHAPSVQSIDMNRYGDIPLNAAYYDNLEELILETKPAIWIHGHVHHSLDYMIGDTRVLCNPRGYVGYEENPNFDVNATVEV